LAMPIMTNLVAPSVSDSSNTHDSAWVLMAD
jgi:hypothetical protein